MGKHWPRAQPWQGLSIDIGKGHSLGNNNGNRNGYGIGIGHLKVIFSKSINEFVY